MNENRYHDFGQDAEVQESVDEQTASSPTADRQGTAVPVVVAETQEPASPPPEAARLAKAILTLADVIDDLRARPDLTPTQKRDWVCAIRSLAKLLRMSPLQLPADGRKLRERLKDVHPSAVKMSPERFANIKAGVEHGLAKALNSDSRSVTGRCSRSAFTPEWQLARDACPTKWIQMKLAAFSRSCSHRGIAPMAVTTSTLETFIDEVDRTSLDLSPVKLRRVISWNWNKCVDEVATWPRLKLDMVPARVPWTLPWSAFTPEFRRDVDKCLARLAGMDLPEEDELDEDKDELDEDGPDKPLRPGTLKWRRFQLRMAASALVATGVAVTEIKNIADVVKPGPYRQVIKNLKARYGGKTAHLYGLATALKTIAKYHCKVTEAELKVLSRICKRNLVRQRGMTLKNRNRLRPFTDPATRDELLLLPQKVMREASKKAKPDRKAALAAQMAVALEIECMAPLRAANLAMLEIGRHLVFVGNGRDEHAVITLPEEEVKNEIALEYPLSSESTRLIKRYIDKFLPLLGQPGGTHLFPSPRGGAKKPNTLSLQVAAVVQKATGHRIHLHLLRHFAAMVYLQKHPGAYAAVQRLLGHATASAAINAYVGLETAAAARRYDEIVLGHRRAAEAAPRRRRRGRRS